MRSIVHACNSGELDACVVGVISNTASAPGLDFANEQSIPTSIVEHSAFANRTEFDQQLQHTIDTYKADWIVLAGFMRILGAELVSAYLGRMVNIHPSLLPRYPGLNTHARVLAAGDSTHGASVHFVTPELDAGPVIAQSKVTVKPDDTEQSLQERVLRTEHKLYVQALQLCVSGAARLLNGECYLGKPGDTTDSAPAVSNRHQHS